MPVDVSENKDDAQAPTLKTGSGNDRVGDLLRKERLTRRIAIETIAKDLKLNVSYIKALEESDYDALPVDPYVRVYIRSLAKYLSLDAESVMKQFYKERGLIVDEKNVGSKIDISVQRQEKNPMMIIAAVLIVILAVFAFIANQKGWLTQSENGGVINGMEKPDSTALSVTDSTLMSEDSSIAALNSPHDSGAVTKTPPRP